MPNSIECFRQNKENAVNFQWRVSIKSTENVMCNGNKLMYARVIMSESWLDVVEKVIFIEELIENVKDQFFKDFRTNG